MPDGVSFRSSIADQTPRAYYASRLAFFLSGFWIMADFNTAPFVYARPSPRGRWGGETGGGWNPSYIGRKHACLTVSTTNDFPISISDGYFGSKLLRC